ncbi:hypothetical protein [Methylobacterium nodulans]|uniref:Uncharacterized protein n=1 Tax=Methylobacterium nodulans (strain LMG 21967 / CNCM I-2342 / ORS 2060) TaxID=460265 RepID=B8IGD4_METNO|nr:hypothetical protein [Methylobacterium nodulans]ACL55834.1 hypothetical protein Mnod_0804 [Methylobacterium nodulans ORS 2060]
MTDPNPRPSAWALTPQTTVVNERGGLCQDGTAPTCTVPLKRP